MEVWTLPILPIWDSKRVIYFVILTRERRFNPSLKLFQIESRRAIWLFFLLVYMGIIQLLENKFESFFVVSFFWVNTLLNRLWKGSRYIQGLPCYKLLRFRLGFEENFGNVWTVLENSVTFAKFRFVAIPKNRKSSKIYYTKIKKSPKLLMNTRLQIVYQTARLSRQALEGSDRILRSIKTVFRLNSWRNYWRK